MKRFQPILSAVLSKVPNALHFSDPNESAG